MWHNKMEEEYTTSSDYYSRAIKNFKHVLTVNNKKQTKTIQKYLVFPVPNVGKYFYFPLLGSQFFEEKKARCELLN